MNTDIYESKELTVITTHLNADFDAMASMLAAQKLYKNAYVVFPGSQEKNLRNFFIHSTAYLFNMVDLKKIDFSKIRRLVLVDTCQENRIGIFSELLKKKDIEVHIYDHHPKTSSDIKGSHVIHRTTGATITLLTEIIKQRDIEISPDEATVMCLGLYEDTGSFTFTSTTEADFGAAAFLLSKGASLNTVAGMISREISPDQVMILNKLVQGSTSYNINGLDIIITTITVDEYIPDFAFLVHKMVKMENLDAIFAIAAMGNKIYLVARSRITEVDVGEIINSFGGGGHVYAASATVKNKTVVQIENELVGLLYKKLRSYRLAKDIMSRPPIIIKADATCKAAGQTLTRYNVNALLVTDNGQVNDRLLGYISRQVIEKARFHRLEHISVKEYMNTELEFVNSNAEIDEIQNKIIDNKQRVLPVIDNNQILGVITRTDLLNLLVHRSRSSQKRWKDPSQEPVHARTRHILKFMKERLSDDILKHLKLIGSIANELGYGAYIVGGFVRDLFLYRPTEDIDIVIEGDGILFAKTYAKKIGARIHTHDKFGTAVVILNDDFKIDVASARLEYYKFPAALPTVEMSSIKLDLFRRDFTINTLCIQLNPKNFGTLIDFFSAQRDLKEKAIRVLHNLSFVEDPTRVFRAIRFEQRFRFNIGKLTSGLIENAVRMNFFKKLSGKRVFSEFKQILNEETPLPALIRLHEYNLLKTLHPAFNFDERISLLFTSVKMVLSWFDLLFTEEKYLKWSVYLLTLMGDLDEKTSREICQRFELSPKYVDLFVTKRLEANRCIMFLEQHLPLPNSTLYKTLKIYRTELILYMMANSKQKKVKRSISHYFTQLRYITTSITGKDLKDMGIKPGPIYRKILDSVLDARLNDKLQSRDEELLFLKNTLL